MRILNAFLPSFFAMAILLSSFSTFAKQSASITDNSGEDYYLGYMLLEEERIAIALKGEFGSARQRDAYIADALDFYTIAIRRINGSQPKFFEWFKSMIESEDPVLIEEALRKAQVLTDQFRTRDEWCSDGNPECVNWRDTGECVAEICNRN